MARGPTHDPGLSDPGLTRTAAAGTAAPDLAPLSAPWVASRFRTPAIELFENSCWQAMFWIVQAMPHNARRENPMGLYL